MNLFTLNAFKPKTIEVYNKYFNLSNNQCISIGIYKNGELYQLDNKTNEDECFYDIGSIAKTFTSHLVLKLVSLYQLDINETIDRYLPLKEGNYPTIYNLLTHTCGYTYVTPISITLKSLLTKNYYKKNIYYGVSKSDVIKALESRRKKKTKNHKYSYSDFTYAVLACLVEQLTKRPFNEVILDFIHNDLNLKNICLGKDNRYPLSVNKRKTYPFWQWNNDNPYIASGGLTSNLSMMMNYLKLEIESNEKYILNSHEICLESFTKKNNIGTSLGWHTYKNTNQYWYVGGVGTFRSSLIFNRKRRIGVCVMGNSKGIYGANIYHLAKIIYKDLRTNKIKLKG